MLPDMVSQAFDKIEHQTADRSSVKLFSLFSVHGRIFHQLLSLMFPHASASAFVFTGLRHILYIIFVFMSSLLSSLLYIILHFIPPSPCSPPLPRFPNRNHDLFKICTAWKGVSPRESMARRLTRKETSYADGHSIEQWCRLPPDVQVPRYNLL